MKHCIGKKSQFDANDYHVNNNSQTRFRVQMPHVSTTTDSSKLWSKKFFDTFMKSIVHAEKIWCDQAGQTTNGIRNTISNCTKLAGHIHKL